MKYAPIQFKRLHDHAILPTRGSAGAAGFDLHTIRDGRIDPGERALIPTGIAVALPPGTCGQIWPRSGLAVRLGMDRLAGLVDEDYRGEVGVLLINHGTQPMSYHAGDRIAQLVVVPYLWDAVEAGDLPYSARGGEGFGSTGR